LDLLTPDTQYSKLQAIQHYRYSHNLQVTVTQTSVLSLLHSPLTVSWQRIHNSLTYEVFFAQPNFFLAIICLTVKEPDIISALKLGIAGYSETFVTT
jgi:hypothetical protein